MVEAKVVFDRIKIVLSAATGAVLGVVVDRAFASNNNWLLLCPSTVLLFLTIIVLIFEWIFVSKTPPPKK